MPKNFVCDHCSNKKDFWKSYPRISSKVCDQTIPLLRSQKWVCYQIYQNAYTHQKLLQFWTAAQQHALCQLV